MIEWCLNLELASPNVAGHWTKRYARDKANKKRISQEWLVSKKKPKAPCIVIFDRHYCPMRKQKLMDHDNYIASLKGVRDAIANLIVPGLAPGQADDRRHGVEFHYHQTSSEISGIIIKFEPKVSHE